MAGKYITKQAMIVSGAMLLSVMCQAANLDFSLYDCYGRQVKSQDYAGVPLFLEFGACW